MPLVSACCRQRVAPRAARCPRAGQFKRHRRRTAAAAGPEDDGERVDIDALAKRLNQEANRMRASGSFDTEDDDDTAASPLDRADSGATASTSQTCSKQAIEAAIGPESFQPNDFVIFNKLGALRVRNVHSGSVLGSVDEADEEALTRVNVFAATYESGRPFQGPVTVLLKEYLPGSRQVGLNDIRTCSALQATWKRNSSAVVQALPEDSQRWKAAQADMTDTAIVPPLGWFESAPSEPCSGPESDSLWLVLKFEGLTPAQAFAAPMPKQGPAQGSFTIFQRPEDLPINRRCAYLRTLFAGALRAVAALHERGVVHNSLGAGSLMVNTLDDARAARLVVKLDNFGFAQTFTGPTGAGSALDRGRRGDQAALAVTFCELVFGSLAMEDGSGGLPVADATSVSRLLLDVFSRDTNRFRQYCLQCDEWADAVGFLDSADGSGWDLVDALLQGDVGCSELVDCAFLAVRV